MNKIIATIVAISTTFSLSISANEQSSSSKLLSEFNQLSANSLDKEVSLFESPLVFIEQEFSRQIELLGKTPTTPVRNNGQWSVSFDLNKFDLQSADWDFSDSRNSINTPLSYDWTLGTSLVSPDQTSRFLVNYGERKVPISISFDDVANGLSQESFGFGLEQKLTESWDISISYLRTENQLASFGGDTAFNQIHEHSYSFDFSMLNQLETVNFSPFSDPLASTNFMDDISAINIKVSRKMSDTLQVNAKASQKSIGFMEQVASELTFNPIQSNEVSLQGQYDLNSQWSIDADIEHQTVSSFENKNSSSSFEQLDSTTLDIGVQYQSNWDQVGVVIRIDLMNLLGVSSHESGQKVLDQGVIKPFSFDTPKYIKVSGSVSF